MVKKHQKFQRKKSIGQHRATIIVLVGIMFSLFLVNFVSSWSNSTFNNSLSSEDLTFNGNENITRWLSVPENTFVTNAYMNLSGVYTYEEDGELSYSCTGAACFRAENAVDENWGSRWDSGCNNCDSYLYENMSSYSSYDGLNWTANFTNFGASSDIEFECWNYSSNSWYKFIDTTIPSATMTEITSEVPNSCINYPSPIQIRNYKPSLGVGTTQKYYEGKAVWFDNQYTINTSIFINNTQIWNHIGEFNSTYFPNKTSNFAQTINDYISTATAVAGYFLVPFLFHSDTRGILQYLGMNFNNNEFLENSQTFNSTTYETESENFEINLSYDSSEWLSISANLIYNGTTYLGSTSDTGNTRVFTKRLNIPIIQGLQQNKSFYWEILLSNATSTKYLNSTTQNQTIDELIFTQCNATYPSPIFVNFTVYNETNLNITPVFMDAYFEYYIKGGSGSVTKNYSFESSTANNTYWLCSNVNKTLITDSAIKLTADGLVDRTYEFSDKEYSNATTHIELFMQSSETKEPGTSNELSNIIIEVQDTGLQPLEGYTVTIERYYPGLGEYKIIVEDKTDTYGQMVARLVKNTVKYKFTFKDTGGVIRKTTGDMTIACRATICILPFVIEDTTDDFSRFTSTTDFEYVFSFDNNTNIFTFTWNDATGDSATVRLLVERVLFNGTSVVSGCNSTSTATSGTLTCNVGSQKAGYMGKIYRQVSGKSELLLNVLNTRVGQTFSTYGREGLLWVFILLMTMIGIGSFNPPIAIILYNVGFLMMGVLGIVSYNLPIFFATNIMMVLFIWAFNRK